MAKRAEILQLESSLVEPSEGLPKNWRNVSTIGMGGTANVYLYETPDGHVAVKSIKVDDNEDLTAEARAEIMHLQKVIADNGGRCHPNVLCYRNVYRDKSYMYLVTDYLDGFALSQWSRNHKKLGENDPARHLSTLRDIAKTAAKGLSYLHSIGIAHRDLHVGNIMVVPTSDPLEPSRVTQKAVLIDLGLSCILDTENKWQTCKRERNYVYLPGEIPTDEDFLRIDVRMLAEALFPAVSGEVNWRILQEGGDLAIITKDEEITKVMKIARKHIYGRRSMIEKAENSIVAEKIYQQLTDVVLAMLQTKNISAEESYKAFAMKTE